jgi:hypothetical protein
MKQKDIALILVVGFVGVVMAVVVSNYMFSGKNSKNLTADKVIAITPEFQEPDKKYFNDKSVDPTQIIRIGENANQKPFNQ